MAYAQRKYIQPMGIPPTRWRIDQVGCFLVAFCNLLERFDKGIDPVRLNREFVNRGIYTDIDDGVRDDLAYSSITRFNKNIVVTAIGNGRPRHNDCIVKFTGAFNGFGTHFSLVHDAKRGTIIDSLDGKIKSWNVYGGPKVWAQYRDNTPKSKTTTTKQTSSTSVVVKSGWGISHIAKAAGYSDWKSEKRWNEIANFNGYSHWSHFVLHPNSRVRIPKKKDSKTVVVQPATKNVTVQHGYGISHVLRDAGYTQEQFSNIDEWQRLAKANGFSDWQAFNSSLVVGQNVQVFTTPLPIKTVSNTTSPTVQSEAKEKNEPAVIPVTITPVDKDAYKQTATDINLIYIAQESVIVKDLDGMGMDKQLVKGQKVNGAQLFTKNGIEYVRTKRSVEDGIWYGVPMQYLNEGQPADEYVGVLTQDDDDNEDFNLDEIWQLRKDSGALSMREHMLAFAAHLKGLLDLMLQKIKVKKS